MTDVTVSQGRVFAAARVLATVGQVSEARVYAVINFPAEFGQLSQSKIRTTGKLNVTALVSEARTYVHGRGRVANPKLRIWTATLDGHDLVFLRLGDDTTLVYDVYSEQWVQWDSLNSGAWRPNCGMNWIGGQALAHSYGSPIVAGDDTFGLLWFLDPEQPYDDNPDPSRAQQQMQFERIISAQALVSGRDYTPCYVIFLDGDNYGLSGTEFTPQVLLEYSDDQGRTFVAAEPLPAEMDTTVDNPYSWYSLGQFGSPGRIFRVTDNGVLTRIDSMQMNDG